MPTEEVKQFVDAKIAGKKVMVFSKTHCPYCAKAKDVFKKHVGKDLSPEEYEVLEIENMADCAEIQDYLLELTGARSVSYKVVRLDLSPKVYTHHQRCTPINFCIYQYIFSINC